jgi:hypothetical protein
MTNETNVYHLRPDELPTETVKCLAELLAQARRKRVKGIAFIAYVDDHGFIANSAGAAHDDPTNTIGMLFSLAVKMHARVDGGSPP